MKYINTYIAEKLRISKKQKSEYTLFPETKEELIKMIKDEVDKNGNECDLNHIDTSKITNMSYLFETAKFNGDITYWDVSNVTIFTGMFASSDFTGENSDINKWDVSKGKRFIEMFYCSPFNAYIGDWDVSNAESMTFMFCGAKNFNQDISRWNVYNVKNMNAMFEDCYDFNQNISNWRINPNCHTSGIFYQCMIDYKFKPKLPNK